MLERIPTGLRQANGDRHHEPFRQHRPRRPPARLGGVGRAGERFEPGYPNTGPLFLGIIAVIALAYCKSMLDAVTAFRLACILTRPLGASSGDLLSQPLEQGGLGFGTVVTSLGFPVAIIATVVYATARQTQTLGLD